jgi:hypothetical protein
MRRNARRANQQFSKGVKKFARQANARVAANTASTYK